MPRAKMTDEERKAKKKAYMLAYNERNKEKIAADKRAYYEENKERIELVGAAYRESHREEKSEYHKGHYKRNKDKVRAYREENKANEGYRGFCQNHLKEDKSAAIPYLQKKS